MKNKINSKELVSTLVAVASQNTKTAEKMAEDIIKANIMEPLGVDKLEENCRLGDPSVLKDPTFFIEKSKEGIPMVFVYLLHAPKLSQGILDIIPEFRDNNGRNAMHYVAQNPNVNNNPQFLKKIMSRKEVLYKDKNDITPLHLLAENMTDYRNIPILLSAKNLHKMLANEQTPATIIANKIDGNDPNIKHLLTEPHSSVLATLVKRMVAIPYVLQCSLSKVNIDCEKGEINALEFLASKGVDVTNHKDAGKVRDFNGNTVAHLLVESAVTMPTQVLGSKLMDVANKEGNTGYHVWVNKGYPVNEFPNVIEAQNTEGDTIYHILAKKADKNSPLLDTLSTDTIKTLIDKNGKMVKDILKEKGITI